MLAAFRRHPFPVVAHFKRSLVLTYALPADTLLKYVPAGLSLDTFGGFGFLAVALVQAEKMRPTFLPNCLGKTFFLAGFRVFVKYKTQSGRTLRGLKILRSYTDRPLLAFSGNLLTHYNYRVAAVKLEQDGERFEIEMQTPGHEADLHVLAEWPCSRLPENSPFSTIREARRFAGPLPYTFDYDAASQSIVMIEGKRGSWNPQPVNATVFRNNFFQSQSLSAEGPVLANAFCVCDVAYRWEKGRIEQLVECPA